MTQYVVTTDCYVPVGESTRFKRAGQVVDLDAADAKALGDLVKRASQNVVDAQVVADKPVDGDAHSGDVHRDALEGEGGVQKLNTSDTDDTPAQSATKAEWVDFAVSQGQSRDDAEALTKAELIEQFGG